MQIRHFLLLVLLCCLSCKNANKATPELEKFDKVKWATKNDLDYPYRDKMLKDLMMHYTLPGVKKDELLNLIGPPDRSDSGYLFYMIAQQRIGFFTLHTKTLVIKLGKDGSVEWRKIHE